jgi:hypothetical protein
MRYCVHEVASIGIAAAAAIVGDNHGGWCGATQAAAIARLVEACQASARLWLAVDSDGAPTALFGVAPFEDDPETGQFWMVMPDAFEHAESDMEQVARLVLDEMLQDYTQLENYIEQSRSASLDLVKSLGFNIEPAIPTAESGAGFHRIWLAGPASFYCDETGRRPAH